MNEYKIFLSEKKRIGMDTENSLILIVTRSAPPIYLSDFVGGKATLCDGLSTSRTSFTIKLSTVEFRVALNNLNPKQLDAELTSPWCRASNSQKIIQSPLEKEGVAELGFAGKISEEYLITGLSWS